MTATEIYARLDGIEALAREARADALALVEADPLNADLYQTIAARAEVMAGRCGDKPRALIAQRLAKAAPAALPSPTP
ncbi:MAG: hypothetical protein RJB26_1811 [Pseudomonadota bacterium]